MREHPAHADFRLASSQLGYVILDPAQGLLMSGLGGISAVEQADRTASSFRELDDVVAPKARLLLQDWPKLRLGAPGGLLDVLHVAELAHHSIHRRLP